MRIAATVAITVLASSLAIPASHAADGDVATAWAAPQTITSGTSGLVVSDTAAMGSLSVAVVSRAIGGGGGVGEVGPRADSGVEFDIYTASRERGWIKQKTIPSATVGTTAGNPQIATDGLGWALTWQRTVSPTRWQVVVATSAAANTDPTFTVLSTDFATGYVRAPDPVIDAAPNEAVINGARYLVAWVADEGLGFAKVRTSEMDGLRRWGASTSIKAYTSASSPSDLDVAYATDRSAAIGYVIPSPTPAVRLITRSADGPWTDGLPPISAGASGTSGIWDLDMTETPTHVSVGWATAAPFVRYARVRLGTGDTVFDHTVGSVAGTADISSLVVTDRVASTVAVAWSEQDSVSPQTLQPYRVRSFVVDPRNTNQFGLGYVTQGNSTGPISLQARTNDTGRVFVATGTTGDTSTSALKVTEAGPAPASPTFWVDASSTTVTGTFAAGTRTRGFGLLVPSSDEAYPRVLWAQGLGTTYSLAFAQQVPDNVTVPSAPQDVFAIPRDSGADVRWIEPSTDGGSAILEYTVTSRPGGLTCTSVIPGCVVTGLTNGTAYTFTVIARNAAGSSLASAPSAAVTPDAAPLVGPLPPVTFTVKAKPGRKVVVRWSASPSAGVAGYVLSVRKNSGPWRDRAVGNVLRATYTVKLNKTFCYRVAAVDVTRLMGDWTGEKCVRGRA